MASKVDARLLKSTKFPPEFNQKVDMHKVNLQVMKKWIANRISQILGSEDDVLVELCFNLIEASQYPDIKSLQIQLTGFLDKDTPGFCKELWNLLLSAQQSPQGVPKELLEAKKLELMQEKLDADRAAEDARQRREQVDRRDRQVSELKEQERRGRNNSRPNTWQGRAGDFAAGRRGSGNGGYGRADRRPPSPGHRGRPLREAYGSDSYVPRGRPAREVDHDSGRRRGRKSSEDSSSPRYRSRGRSASGSSARSVSPSGHRAYSPGQHRASRRRSRTPRSGQRRRGDRRDDSRVGRSSRRRSRSHSSERGSPVRKRRRYSRSRSVSADRRRRRSPPSSRSRSDPRLRSRSSSHGRTRRSSHGRRRRQASPWRRTERRGRGYSDDSAYDGERGRGRESSGRKVDERHGRRGKIYSDRRRNSSSASSLSPSGSKPTDRVKDDHGEASPSKTMSAEKNDETREARRSENLLKEKMLRERILKMRNSSEDDALAGNRS